MKRENIHDLLIGVALVALGFAVYRHFTHAGSATIPATSSTFPSGVDQGSPATGTGGDVAGFYDLDAMLSGAT